MSLTIVSEKSLLPINSVCRGLWLWGEFLELPISPKPAQLCHM